MPAAYTGFGSGPYDTLKYDRSWVTAFVTLGTFATDSYVAKAEYNPSALTLGTAVEAVKLADGHYYTTIALGFGVLIPTASVGGNYGVELTFGTAVAKEHINVAEYYADLTLGVSAESDIRAQQVVNDTVTLGTSVENSFLAAAVINAQLSLGTGFTYDNTTKFVANNNLDLTTNLLVLVSSTGRFVEQWTSVTAGAGETWTSVPLGF
jgi:hypothetical protein